MKRFMVCGLTTAAMVTMMSAAPMTTFGAVNRGAAIYVGTYGNNCTISGNSILGNERPGTGNFGNGILNGGIFGGAVDGGSTGGGIIDGGSTGGGSTGGQVQEPSQDLAQSTFSAQVLELVNAERRKAGMAPLELDAGAEKAAQKRAEEIAKVFSHTRPDGSSYSTALKEAGVNYRASGENIAYGQRSPEAVMEGWMNSSGHRANILSGNFGSIGIGHYKDSSGTDYWVQLFTD